MSEPVPAALAWRSESAPGRDSYWQARSRRRPSDPLDGDTRADLVVIGAGASGLWTAWALLDADPALDLLVIDAGTIGSGAAGRGLGITSAWTAGDPAPHRTGTLDTALLRDAVVEVGGTAAAEQIECDFRYRGALRVARDARGLARLHPDPAAEDRVLDARALSRRVLVPGAVGGLSTPDCATLDPVRLLSGLADTLVSRGARLAEHTRALRISPGAVLTDQGIIRTERVVQATGAHTVPGGSWAPDTITESAIATAPVPDELWERIGLRRGQLLHLVGPTPVRALRTDDHRLLLSGTVSTGRTLNRLLGRLAPDRRRSEIAELFGALSQVPITHHWSWTRARTASHPVGVSTDGSAWVGGHGPEPFAAANLSGRVLADLLTGADTALTRAAGGRW